MYHIISQYAKGIFNAAFAAVILNVYLGLFLEEKKRRWMNCLYWLPFLAWHVVWIWMMQNHLRFPNTVNLFINLTQTSHTIWCAEP